MTFCSVVKQMDTLISGNSKRHLISVGGPVCFAHISITTQCHMSRKSKTSSEIP